MNLQSLSNLDSLVERVRDQNSRDYISEAITTYKAGAYRTAIISTWLALVYDILSKIRELSERNDGLALTHISELDNAINNSNIPKMQSIEDSILKVAFEDFELISLQDFDELQRLKKDRNLCAHPAFTGSKTLYQPVPELVRTHIVHCLVKVLIQQPVQGKMAIDEFGQDLTSTSFPEDYGKIRNYIVSKYLSRSKESFVVNIIKVLLKILIKNDSKFKNYRQRIILSLTVISEEYKDIYSDVVSTFLKNSMRTIDEKNVDSLSLIIGTNEKIWKKIEIHQREKVKNIVDKYIKESDDFVENFKLVSQFQLDDFNDIETNLINTIRDEVDSRIEKLSEAGSYRSAEIAGEKVADIVSHIGPSQFVKLIDAFTENKYDQILGAAESPSIWSNIFDNYQFNSLMKKEWNRLAKYIQDGSYSSSEYSGLLEKIEKL